jgi:UDP-N-acetylmuramoyl-tripeptide--D-alanyl-D-alanine ligase
LILDAYNANPSSVSLAIDNFERQSLKNKSIILGDMLELGEYAKQEHQKILIQVSQGSVKNIMLVGAHFGQLKNEFSQYHFFVNVDELNDFLIQTKIAENTVLIKGSRGIQLEKTVKFL